MLKLYNTLNRKKELFIPIHQKEVRMYTCGPTVYDRAHIGNLSAYLFADLLKRYLRYSDYNVIDVMNLTDVDDKTIKAAQKNNQPLVRHTSHFIDLLLEDFKKINIATPKILCRATDNIDEMINLIQKLIDNGYAYEASDGSVYYKINTFKDYGKFACIKKSDLRNNASKRINNDEYKKEEAQDFVLWKAWTEKDGEVYWNSPFGKGRPGWHIECSAMSMKYLGETFDIHTGAIDLIFPHHQNEIAQSEAATGKKFVNFWLHRGFLKVNNEKMSKSLGNMYSLNDIIEKKYDPLTFRYLVLTNHYRLGLNFTFESLEMAQNGLNRLQNFIDRLHEVKVVDVEPKNNQTFNKIIEKFELDFKKAMDDDLNTPKAIAELFDFVKKINILIDKDKINVVNAQATLKLLEKINLVWAFLDLSNKENDKISIKKEVEELIEKRKKYREGKDWENADKVRKRLEEMSVVIEDKKDFTEWKIKK